MVTSAVNSTEQDKPSPVASAAGGGGAKKLSLEVIPYFGKVEELKKDPPQAPPPAHPGQFVPHALRDGEQLAARKGGVADPTLLALESEIVERLRTIFDPEIPVNIYDLGLIYDIIISAERKVSVLMTLTAPGCPVAGILPKAVERKIAETPGVAGAVVELVWEPQWTKEMMSEAARLELGLV